MSKGTPSTTFRIPLDIKAAALAEASRRGEHLTDVVVRTLDAYGRGLLPCAQHQIPGAGGQPIAVPDMGCPACAGAAIDQTSEESDR